MKMLKFNGVKIKLLIPAMLLMLLIAISLLFAPSAKAQDSVYYLGDAIIYNGQVIIGSTNLGGGLELFKLEKNKLVRAPMIKYFKAPNSSADNFYDLAFSQEQDKLFVYLVDGRYLYKYDISDLSAPALVSQVMDNGWDYFMGVDVAADKVITLGIKGIKVWNSAGQIIDAYNITNKFSYNLNYQSGNLILDATIDHLRIFDKNTRQFIAEIPFTMGEDHNRKTFVNQTSNSIYLVDDASLKKFDYQGNLKNSFKHISNRGYDVAGFADQNHLYFTDGKSVVKFSKDNLKPIKIAYTTDLGEKNGWAMGLKVLRDSAGEKIVIFNNSSILVLDQNLKLISQIAATPSVSQPRENLFLRVDKNRAAAGSIISLSGGGYASNEELLINFSRQSNSVKTDNQGRFTKIITVPTVLPIRTDIKVVGKNSGLSYSIGFAIE